MLDRTLGTRLSMILMDIAQDPLLRQDLDQVLGNFCHQSRNRLNSLKLSIYLAKRQNPHRINERWRLLELDYQKLEKQIERVQSICQPLCVSLVRIGLDLLFEDRHASWSKIMADHGQELEFLKPEGRSVACFDVNLLGAALDALVAWRAEQGTCPRKTSVRWGVESGQAYVKWIEPPVLGPIPETKSPNTDTAWTLPTLTRVIVEHGGLLEVDDQHGWSLTLSWPTATK